MQDSNAPTPDDIREYQLSQLQAQASKEINTPPHEVPTADDLAAYRQSKGPQISKPAPEDVLAYKQQTGQDTNNYLNRIGKDLETSGASYRDRTPVSAMETVNGAAEKLGLSKPFEDKDFAPYYAKWDADQKSINERYPIKGPQNIADVHTASELGDYAASQAGMATSQMMQFIGSGLGAASVAKAGFKAAATAAGLTYTDTQLAQAAFKGMSLAGASAMAPQAATDFTFNELQKGIHAPFTGLAVGALTAGIYAGVGPFESIASPVTKTLGRILGNDLAAATVTGSALKQYGVSIAKDVGTSTAQGLASTFVNQLGDHFVDGRQDLFSKDNIRELIDAGFTQATLGAISGAAHPALGGKSPTEAKLLQEEVVGKANDEANIGSTYVDPKMAEQAKGMGVNSETLAKLAPDELKAVQDAIQNRYMIEKQGNVKLPPSNPFSGNELYAKAWDRLQSINSSVIPDAKNIDFRPSDGVIHKGTPVNLDQSIINPMEHLDVTDHAKLEAMNQTAMLQTAGKNSIQLRTDNPGGDWLVKKQISAQQGYKPAEEGMTAKGLAGAITGTFKGTADNHPTLPTSMLKDLPGANNEHLKDTSAKLNKILSDPRTKDGIQEPIMVGVNHRGEAYVMEGNNRLKAAVQTGTQRVPVEIQYRNGGETIQGQFHPDKVKAQAVDSYLLKNAPELPIHGNLADDWQHPTAIAKNLEGLEHTPEGAAKHGDLIDNIQRIASEVFGKNSPLIKTWDKLRVRFDHDPVFGAQHMNIVHLAMNEKTNPRDLNVTAYHEFFHTLMQRGAFSPEQVKFMLGNVDTIKKYMDKDEFLSTQDHAHLMQSPVMREELLANAFGHMAEQFNRDRASISLVPNGFRQIFRQAKNFLEKIGNAIKGQGFNSFNDIMQKTVEGGMADKTGLGSRAALTEHVQELTHQLGFARLMRGAADIRKADFEGSTKRFESVLKEALKESNQMWDEGKQLSAIGKVLWTPFGYSTQHPLFGVVYNSFQRKMSKTKELLNNYSKATGGFFGQDRASIQAIGEIADHLSQTGQKGYLDKDGFLTYKRDGQVVRINDKDISKQYMNLQAGHAKVLDSFKDAFLNHVNDRLGMLGPNGLIKSIEDVHYAMGNIGDVKTEQNKATYRELSNVEDRLYDFQRMSTRDYAPKTRFGSFGFALHDKDGNLVHFGTIENGTLNGYNKTQYAAAITQMKELQKKTPELYWDKDGQRPVKSLDNAQPFKMTYSTLSSMIDPRYMNIELIKSLLSSDKLDPMAFEAASRQLYDDWMKKGFERKFDPDKNVPGYSTDWNRSLANHFTSSAHFITSLDHQREIGAMRTAATGLADDRVKGKVEDMIKYNTMPQKEQQLMRQINYLWVMGGNVSTAATVLMTLPTTALGQVSKYDTNIFRSMAGFGKYSRLATQWFMTAKGRELSEDGSIHSMPKEDAALDSAKKGQCNVKTAKFFNKMVNQGEFGMPLRDEATGQVQSTMQHATRLLATPVAWAERTVRAATALQMHDSLVSNPDVKARAMKVLANDHNFQARIAMDPRLTWEEHAAMHTIDQAHGVYGKLGRPDALKGLGGSLFMPFQTYPYYALEGLVRAFGEGPEGRRALAVTLGSVALISGLGGIPGYNQVNDAYQQFSEHVEHHKADLDLMLREKLNDMTGDKNFGTMITHGLLRRFGGIEGSTRYGLPVPGWDQMMAIAGLKGQPSASLGVEGTFLNAMASAWREYNADGSKVDVAKAMMPSSIANVMKAYQLHDEGLWSNANQHDVKTQMLKPDQITNSMLVKQALGLTSSQVAHARQARYDDYMTSQQQYSPMMDKFKARTAMAIGNASDAAAKGNHDGVIKANQESQAALDELRAYLIKYPEAKPPPVTAITKVLKQERYSQFSKPTTMEQVKMREMNKGGE